MDHLPSELVANIFEAVDSLQDLLTLRCLARRYRNGADRFCAHVARRLALFATQARKGFYSSAD